MSVVVHMTVAANSEAVIRDSWHKFSLEPTFRHGRDDEYDEHKHQPPTRKVPVLRKANQTPTEVRCHASDVSKFKLDEFRVAGAWWVNGTRWSESPVDDGGTKELFLG